jgi:hypothetical protein
VCVCVVLIVVCLILVVFVFRSVVLARSVVSRLLLCLTALWGSLTGSVIFVDVYC